MRNANTRHGAGVTGTKMGATERASEKKQVQKGEEELPYGAQREKKNFKINKSKVVSTRRTLQ